jgi:methyl-accepting chemotaxis protein
MKRGFSLVAKIAIGMILTVVIFALVGFLTLRTLDVFKIQVHQLGTKTLGALQTTENLRYEIQDLRTLMYKSMTTGTAKELKVLESSRNNLMLQIKKNLVLYKNLGFEDSEFRVSRLGSAIDSMNNLDGTVLDLLKNGQAKIALEALEGPSELTFQNVHSLLMPMIQETSQQLAQADESLAVSMTILTWLIGGGIGASTLIALLVTLLMGISLQRRFKIFLENFSKGAEGDLTSRVTKVGHDELGLLAKNLNDLMDKLRSLIRVVQESSEKSRQQGSELSSHATELSATTVQMDATMAQIKRHIQDLRQAIQNGNTSVSIITELVGSTVPKIEVQSKAISDASSAVEQMATSLKNLDETTKTKRELSDKLAIWAHESEDDMTQTLSSIVEISKATEVISEFTRIINEVASQTGLLAMNAAIEAAHAGDAGKGFAVVADEIRKLSEATAVNSKSISLSLREIIDRIDGTKEVSQRTGQTIDRLLKGIQDISQAMAQMQVEIAETAQGGRMISQSLTGLVDTTSEIKEEAQKMGKEAEKSRHSMEIIVQMADANAAAVTETTAGITEITNSVNELARIAQENADTALKLEQETSRFKTEV